MMTMKKIDLTGTKVATAHEIADALGIPSGRVEWHKKEGRYTSPWRGPGWYVRTGEHESRPASVVLAERGLAYQAGPLRGADQIRALAKTYRGSDSGPDCTEEFDHRYWETEGEARAALRVGETLATRGVPGEGWLIRGYQSRDGFSEAPSQRRG